jgi:hypothetical protein
VIQNVKAEQGCDSSDPGSCHAFHTINYLQLYYCVTLY